MGDALLHALAGAAVLLYARFRLHAHGRRLLELALAVLSFGIIREAIQHADRMPWVWTLHVWLEAVGWGAGAALVLEWRRARVILVSLVCVVGFSRCAIARTFSPHGHRDYRIEYRPARVCVPKNLEHHAVTACVRALRLLGGGSIEVPK